MVATRAQTKNAGAPPPPPPGAHPDPPPPNPPPPKKGPARTDAKGAAPKKGTTAAPDPPADPKGSGKRGAPDDPLAPAAKKAQLSTSGASGLLSDSDGNPGPGSHALQKRIEVLERELAAAKQAPPPPVVPGVLPAPAAGPSAGAR